MLHKYAIFFQAVVTDKSATDVEINICVTL